MLCALKEQEFPYSYNSAPKNAPNLTQQGFNPVVNDYGPGIGTNRVRFMFQNSGQPILRRYQLPSELAESSAVATAREPPRLR